MSRPALRLPSPALLILVVLFFTISGSVVAGVKVAKNSIGSAQVKNGSLRGADLGVDALGGAQIQEHTLATVPRATAAATAGTAQSAQTARSAATAERAATAASADRATDAERLGGRGADQYLTRAEVFTLAAKLHAGETKLLLERDGVRIYARCQTGVPAIEAVASVFTAWAESSRAGAMLDSPSTGNRLDGTGGQYLGPSTSEGPRQLLSVTEVQGAARTRLRAGFTVTSADGTTIFAGFGQPTTDAPGDKSNATNGIRVSFGLYGADCAIAAPVMVSSFG